MKQLPVPGEHCLARLVPGIRINVTIGLLSNSLCNVLKRIGVLAEGRLKVLVRERGQLFKGDLADSAESAFEHHHVIYLGGVETGGVVHPFDRCAQSDVQRGEHADVAHHVVVAANLLVCLNGLLQFCRNLYGRVLPGANVEIALFEQT